MDKKYDIIIAGAGAAGLSLAWFIMHSKPLRDKKVLLIDQSLTPTDEKTWCFWDEEDLPVKSLIHHTWNTLEVNAHGQTFSENLSKYRYHCMRSLDYSKHILKRAEESSSIKLLETSIQGFDSTERSGVVQTGSGTFEAEWVFQSVFKSPSYKEQKVDVSLKQHFLGVEIETEKPLFDPDKVTLMDFETSQKHGVTFFYILPFTTTNALIEYTFFTEHVLSDDEYEAGIRSHLKLRYNLDEQDYKVVRTEKGAIPMEDRHYPQWYNKRVLNIGTVGGLTKPSTGYTFTRIHHHSSNIVKALESGNTPPPSSSSRYRFRVYDMMLLYILKEHPGVSVKIFRELFKRNRFDRILQFLEEKTTFGQEISIFASLPYMPFFKAIYRMKHRILTGA